MTKKKGRMGFMTMPAFEQEWISPILEVYKKRKIEDPLAVILGLNPIGQVLCRRLYEETHFETVLVFNSPQFTTWNRYPADVRPPVIPVHGMISDDLMLVFGDVVIKDYEWLADMLFYLRGCVPVNYTIAFMTHDGPTCGMALSRKGERLLKRMEVPVGRPNFYDGLTGPLISVGDVADIDPVVIFLEEEPETEVILQVDEVVVTQADLDKARLLLSKGLGLRPPTL